MSVPNKEYYKKKSIEMINESKKTISLDTNKVLEIRDDCELGKFVRELVKKKYKECSEHIKKLKSL